MVCILRFHFPRKFKSLVLAILFFLINNINGFSQAFSDETVAAGINLVHDGAGLPGDTQSMGSGAVWFDYNNDGNLDLFVTMRLEGNKLYRNNGDGTFTEVAQSLGVADATHDGSGAAAADFNNDGWQDLFLANSNQDVLLRNNGGNSFSDITASAGISTTDQSRGASASWGDYNEDGFLDLFVANHNMVPGYSNGSTQDRLYRNNGDETFTDVSNILSATGTITGFGFIGGWTDYDRDGDPDLILINDCLSTNPIKIKIFRNDGDTHPTLSWNFTEVSVPLGIDDCANGMGIAVGDYDRDGWLDLFYSDIGPANLFKNNNGQFNDVSGSAGVNGQVFPDFSWGTNFFDYDLDGWLDLFLVVGSHHYPASEEPKPNMLFHNNGNGINFSDVSAAMNMNHDGRARTSVFGDYDNDGDPEMFIVNYGEAPLLMKNNNTNNNHFLKIHLIGTTSNYDGIGSYIKLTTPDGLSQYLETRSGSSLGGGDAIDAYFGLGSNTSVTSLEITWPSGIVQVVENINADQYITVVEPLDQCLGINIPAPEGMDAEVCEGNPFPALMATTEPGLEINWYNSASDGVLLAENTTSFTPSEAGTYFAEARDPATGCSSDIRTALTLTVNENPSVWGGLNEFACLGTPVTFVAETEGGDGNYSYAWTDGLSFTNTLTVAPPVHTSYTVTVTDGNGCQDTDVVTAVVYELPAVTAGDDATICDGDCVTLSAIGSEGQSPYEYNWSGGSEEVCPNTTTTYTVTVTDDNGCTATDEQTVNVLPTPFADAGEDISVCLNDCFTFDPTATGGVEPYTFSWSGDEQETVCPEATTTYTLTVTGDNGCASTDEIKITVNELPVVNAGTDISLCLGDCYTFTPSSTGGSGEYQYTWSSGTEEVCPTQSTTYSVTVTDSNGCTATDELTITVNELPVVDAGTDISLCLGGCYTFTPSATGGGGGYQYTWSSGTEEVCPTETTTYSVTVTDSNGCSSTDEITITINELPVVNAGTDISLCVGECYTFVPSSTGGSGGYQYTWSSGTEEVCPTETTTYSVTVTDSNGCASTDEIMITVNELPVVNAGTDVSLCLGECYTFAPSSTGGSGGYQYTWSSGTEEVCPTQTTTYSVTVTDSNGCSATDEITITVNELPTVNAGEDIGLCLGECYTFTPSSTGGSGDYQYTWSSGTEAVCPTQTTTYIVTVTDSNGCSATDEITITVHELPVADAGADEALCLGDCFTFTPAAGGGQPPYNYSWSGDGSTTVCPAQTTTYTLTVTDAAGCTSTDEITITVNPLPIVELGEDVVVCQGSCYTFDPQTTNGTAPYTYSWSSGTNEVCPTQTTTYSVTVTDANGCSHTDAITVFVAELPTVNAGDDVSICSGECYTFNPNAFGGSGGYEYAWSSGSEVVCPSGTTTYTVTVTDSNGCTSTDEITINVVEAPIVDAGTDVSICQGECYTFDASAGGGQPPYDYSWSSGTNEVCPSQTTTYTLTVTDAIGCSSTDEITVTVNDLPMVELGEDVVICAGECITLSPIASGGGGDYQYTWSEGSAEVCPTQTSTYSVTVTDNNGCSAEDAITVFVAPLPQADAGMDVNLCPGACFTFEPSGSGGSVPYVFEWNTPATTVCPTQSTTYSVTVTDSNGCTATDELTINLLPELMVTAGEDTAICSGTCYSLSAAGSGGTGSYTYTWSSGEVMVCPEQTTTYTVTITDTEGCSATDEMTIIVHSPTDPITQSHEMCTGDCVTYQAGDFGLTTFVVDNQMTGEVTFCEGGNYSIGALDENMCSTSVNFSILQTAPPEALAGPDQMLTCATTEVILGQNTAQPGINFQWSNGVNTPVQTVDQTGVYILTATNTALNCGTTDTVTVAIDTLPPLADAGVDLELTCASPTLSANGSGSSQGDEYVYAWTTADGNILNGFNTLMPEITATGTYLLSVSNTLNSCTAQDDLLVTQAEEPGLEIVQVIPVDCHEEATGSITVAGQGGTPIYSYAWSHGAATATADNLAAGTYTVTLTDANGCEVTQSIEVTEPPAIVLALSATAETSSLGSRWKYHGGSEWRNARI
jgi:hypothetical protein